MNRQNSLNRFHFNDDLSFDDQVDSKARLYRNTLVDQRERRLTLDGDATRRQFMPQALLIDGLKEPRTERLMHRERRVDNLTRNLVLGGTRLNRLCASASLRFNAHFRSPGTVTFVSSPASMSTSKVSKKRETSM